jgi:hypothetical protein
MSSPSRGKAMKRRSKAGGKAGKSARHKATTLKRRRTSPKRCPVVVRPIPQEKEIARLTRERDQALEQQTAASEVLQIISGARGDLQSVFTAMLERAVRICDATFGNIYRWQDGALHLVASYNTPPALAEARRRLPLVPYQLPNHVIDAAATSEYKRGDPGAVAAVELGGVRTFLALPILWDNELIGSFSVYRQKVHPFTDKQIELVKNFAAQAIIAIENARLLNELRQRTTDLTERTADLTEALERQTATSEVLQVISSSPGDLQPVFATMLENAVRICEAKFGNIYRWDGEALQLVATHNTPPAYAEERSVHHIVPIRIPLSVAWWLIRHWLTSATLWRRRSTSLSLIQSLFRRQHLAALGRF